jgi:hypothetical protein
VGQLGQLLAGGRVPHPGRVGGAGGGQPGPVRAEHHPPDRVVVVQNGYDPENHRYRPDYVKPAFLTPHLSLRLDDVEERPETFEFFLREVDGPFSLTIPRRPVPSPETASPGHPRVRDQRPVSSAQVSHPGEYEAGDQASTCSPDFSDR